MQSNVMDLAGASSGMNNNNSNNTGGSDSNNSADAKGAESSVAEGSELPEAFKQVRRLEMRESMGWDNSIENKRESRINRTHK